MDQLSHERYCMSILQLPWLIEALSGQYGSSCLDEN